jgi:hypothetical protein
MTKGCDQGPWPRAVTKGRDQSFSCIVIGGKVGAGPSSLYTVKSDQGLQWMKKWHGILHVLKWIRFHGHPENLARQPQEVLLRIFKVTMSYQSSWLVHFYEFLMLFYCCNCSFIAGNTVLVQECSYTAVLLLKMPFYFRKLNFFLKNCDFIVKIN